jgi:hypothetical protein
MNPLFSDEPNPASNHHPSGYVLPRQDRHRIDPPASPGKDSGGAQPAVELIRRKIDALYADEPDAKEELAEASHHPRSKHQQFMHELSTAGKSLAEIQTAWHE